MPERFSKTTRIQEIFSKSSRLAQMPRDTQLLSSLDQGIKSMLSGQLADHCQIGKIEHNVVIYYVDSPIWAYTFKMAKPHIINTLRLLGESHPQKDMNVNQPSDTSQEALHILRNLEDIQIRVRPSIARTQRPIRKPQALPKLSKEIGKSIEATAATFSDEELAKLWRDFAQKHST